MSEGAAKYSIGCGTITLGETMRMVDEAQFT